MCESTAILQYAGRITGLYPADPMKSLRVDEMICMIKDINSSILTTMGLPFKERVESRRKAAKDFGRILSNVERRFTEIEGPYLLGNDLTIADVVVAVAYDTYVQRGSLDGIEPEDFESASCMKAVYDAVQLEPKIKAYYAAKQ